MHEETSNERATPIEPPSSSRVSPLTSRAEEWTLKSGSCRVHVGLREVWVNGALRPLQPRAFNLLVYLIDNRDRVVSTNELLDHIWKDDIVQLGSLAAAVMRIRKALRVDDEDGDQAIRTHHRVGYRFVGVLTTKRASDVP